jgi:antimicrobial peptide system SdpB family protein
MRMRRFVGWLTTEHWLIGAGIMRISVGAWAVFYYLLHWRFRAYLWGPDGVLPFEQFMELNETLSVFKFSRSEAHFQAIYIAAIAIAVLVVIGFRPRLTVPLHWLMVWSFLERNPFLGDGGDNIMRIVLFFLAFANTSAYFSVHADRGSARRVSVRDIFQPALRIAHNIAMLLIVVQLCMMYMSTGLYKVMGELWQNGTALYYILRVDEFSWPGVAEFIYRNPYLVVFGTYGTVLFELMFVPLLLNRWTRYLMLGAGCLFHLGIAAVMGLVTFGWSMLSIYPLLLTDREYREAASWIRNRWHLTLLFDADCAFCTCAVHLMDAANLFSLVEYAPYQTPGMLTRHGIPLERATRRMQGIAAGGRLTEGMDSLVQICGRSPGLWLLLPIVWIGRFVFDQRLYDFVAARRYRIWPGRCAISTTSR